MRWLGVVNIVLVGMIAAAAVLFVFSGKEEVRTVYIPKPDQKELPKSSFGESDEFFQSIGEGVLNLTWVPPQMQLPDLRQELVFYGKNLRPDALAGKASFHIALKGSDERSLVRENEKIYLVYQGTYSPKILKSSPLLDQMADSPLWGVEDLKEQEDSKNAYVFSPGNQPTPLWFEVKNRGEQTLDIRVSMLDEKGALVNSPTEWRSFQLQAQDFSKSQISGWEIGGYRVDTTLLVRQKARWIGPDLFLEMHGGDEYTSAIGKERIDFNDGQEPYSCFAGPGDFLIWKDDRWVNPGEEDTTDNYPLLVVKKIDEKIMTFELWDAEGKGKTLLSLIRAKDHHGTPNIQQEMKFVGAKTWAQFTVDCRVGGRMTLKVHDWLVFTPEGWVKLDSPEKIDAYVHNNLSGPLFILDKMTKQNGRQILLGHLFNAARTEVEHVELSSTPTTAIANFCRQIPTTPPILPTPPHMELEGVNE